MFGRTTFKQFDTNLTKSRIWRNTIIFIIIFSLESPCSLQPPFLCDSILFIAVSLNPTKFHSNCLSYAVLGTFCLFGVFHSPLDTAKSKYLTNYICHTCMMSCDQWLCVVFLWASTHYVFHTLLFRFGCRRISNIQLYCSFEWMILVCGSFYHFSFDSYSRNDKNKTKRNTTTSYNENWAENLLKWSHTITRFDNHRKCEIAEILLYLWVPH